MGGIIGLTPVVTIHQYTPSLKSPSPLPAVKEKEDLRRSMSPYVILVPISTLIPYPISNFLRSLQKYGIASLNYSFPGIRLTMLNCPPISSDLFYRVTRCPTLDNVAANAKPAGPELITPMFNRSDSGIIFSSIINSVS